ncbi:hypothetical protein [Shouchella clausii]|uniref:Uncharacterized protein n=1 Tax=Shouchella clausii TaxID=79880 RepID=A0A268RZN6_SHOCL|nr:hypothetical protein [Shouchella clausii]PAD42939.1 hypothetical protein CHH54_09675 [Bacillus sp. 7520-S]MBU8597122.1 hypothetical protein [Shouchella clausii]MCY1104315.1 hypothetical protein [Shouchella clausii]MEB5479642.1 hypothetical protein [Shouchella clausii]MED4159441.1 hypothetical protein [Shouchella clausii]
MSEQPIYLENQGEPETLPPRSKVRHHKKKRKDRKKAVVSPIAHMLAVLFFLLVFTSLAVSFYLF